jgi:hypothetical protein
MRYLKKILVPDERENPHEVVTNPVAEFSGLDIRSGSGLQPKWRGAESTGRRLSGSSGVS